MSKKYSYHDYSSEMKRCSSCEEESKRSSDNFRKDRKTPDGLQYICKKCAVILCKKSRDANIDTLKKYQKTPNFVFSQLKYQAKKRGIPFEITLDYYLKELVYKKCVYCGSGKTKHWIDRYQNDHAIGYTVDNCVPCCELCNKMKSAWSPDVFMKHCARVADHLESFPID